MKIEGSIVLVTGGASGIGAYISSYYSDKGAIVYICDVQEELGKKISNESNNKIKFIKCDVSKEEEVQKLINIIKEEQGRLDIVILAAGIFHAELTATTSKMHSKETFEKIYKVNVLGCFLVAKYAAKLMIEQSKNSTKDCNGNIIFIASITGYEGARGQLAYSSSKASIIGFTIPMARDLGKYKIRVNTVAPGLIDTPMGGVFKGHSMYDDWITQTPLKQIGKPVHICQTTEFIVKCDFFNGATIRVDGGARISF